LIPALKQRDKKIERKNMAKKRNNKAGNMAEENKAKGVDNESVEIEGPDTENSENQNGPASESLPMTKMEQLQQEVETARNRAAEASDQYVRLLAEFDNFRKRSRKEMSTMREYAAEGILTALLPVIDNFERSLTVMEETDNLSSVKEGIRMVNENLHRVLEKEGLNPISSLHQDFDSELHEAIHSMAVEEEDKKGKVLEVVEKGYRLKDKVIRYSKVIVGE
jgi:molecular chaperone GrpE